jgi:hypothetical protein
VWQCAQGLDDAAALADAQASAVGLGAALEGTPAYAPLRQLLASPERAGGGIALETMVALAALVKPFQQEGARPL